MYSVVSVAPSGEPLSLTEVKKHLRVDNDEEDALIYSWIESAREMVERHTNRSLVTQTRVIRMDNFPPCETIRLTNAPVQSLTSITYSDENDATQTLSSSLYYTDFYSDIPRIVVKDFWPAAYDKPNAVVITYVAGYGEATVVPSALKSAMLLIIGHLYENREQAAIEMFTIPYGAEVLMNPFVLEQPVTYHAYRSAR